jgi:hypothetical protein
MNDRRQIRILSREFLFRMVDLELLSPQGDIGALLGQFAGILVFFGAGRALLAMFIDARTMTLPRFNAITWSTEHSMIAVTMLVVGLFAVLSWDSTFLDRRDVMILSPMPIRTRTLFLAKIGAAAGALGITVVALNGLMSLVWPVVLAPLDQSIGDMLVSPLTYRAFAAYWISVIAGGAFIYCSVLGVQGLAAQLPRRIFLRVSGFLQMGAFCLFVSVYLLGPGVPPRTLDPRMPSHWFFALFHAINGTLRAGWAPLARRAAIALAIAVFSAATAFVLSYVRTLRRIVEEPDILPTGRRRSWSARFGNALETAVVLFGIRTLLRSRQHRVILAFYLGIGFAIMTIFIRFPAPQQMIASYGGVWGPRPNPSLLISTVVMLCFCLLGTRVVFSMPLELRANWIFRIAPIRGARECLAATRRTLLVLGVAPVVAISAALLFWLWPWQQAAAHVVVMAFLGLILTDVSLIGYQKIPFTCSYLPGKSKMHMKFWYLYAVLLGLPWAAQLECEVLANPLRRWAMVASFAAVAVVVRRYSARDRSLLFEEQQQATLFCLDLHRDGFTVMD